MRVAFVTVFNVGEYRRRMTGVEIVMADFFHPTNDDARRIRELEDSLFTHIYAQLLTGCLNHLQWPFVSHDTHVNYA